MDVRVDVQTEAPVRVDSLLCSRFRSPKSGCAACAAVCPVAGAVRLTEEGAAVTSACVSCGACVSACPNGAIAARHARDADSRLAERIRERVQAGVAFRIACTRGEGRAELVLPCLSRLTEALVLEPIRNGAARVELLDPDCQTCGLKKAATQWEKVATFSDAMCTTAGLGADRVLRRRVPNGTAQETNIPGRRASSRRDLFRAIAGRFKEDDETTSREQAHESGQRAAPFREVVRSHPVNPKRSALLEVLGALPDAKPASMVVPAGEVPVAQVEVDGRCTGCNVCETLCPVGALSHRDEGGGYFLDLEAAQCTGCGLCEAICFHEAIHVRPTVDLITLFERGRTTLISAARRTCPGCRESFLGDSGELCPNCRVTGDRREAIARRFFMRGDQSDQRQ